MRGVRPEVGDVPGLDRPASGGAEAPSRRGRRHGQDQAFQVNWSAAAGRGRAGRGCGTIRGRRSRRFRTAGPTAATALSEGLCAHWTERLRLARRGGRAQPLPAVHRPGRGLRHPFPACGRRGRRQAAADRSATAGPAATTSSGARSRSWPSRAGIGGRRPTPSTWSSRRCPASASRRSPDRPFGQRTTARLFNTLMTEVLGYGRYLAQGGDWGALVTSWLARDHGASAGPSTST